MQCLECNTILEETPYHDVMVHRCQQCGSIWLHKEELNKILKSEGENFESCSEEIIEKASATEEKKVSCPSCKEPPLKKITFLHYSDIPILHCVQCGGLYLKKYQLEAIIAYEHHLESSEAKLPRWIKFLQTINALPLK